MSKHPESVFPSMRLKYVVSLRKTRADEGESDRRYIGLESIQSWSGRQRDASEDGIEESSLATTDEASLGLRFETGDVLFGKLRPYLAKVWVAEFPGRSSTELLVMKPVKVKAGFLRYVCLWRDFIDAVDASTFGSKMPRADWDSIGNVSIPVPSDPIQGAICEFLDRTTARIDALIAAKERVLALLAEKRRAIISHAVTRGMDPQVSLRDSNVAWLSDIPAHWGTTRVAWLFRERDERGEPDLPLLEVSINSGVVLREFSDERIEATAADFNTYKVARRGDVVFNKMRMWQGAVGVAPQDGLVSPDYVVASPEGALTSAYAQLLFRTSAFSAECARHSHGIVWDRLRLYWDGFREIEVPLPPFKEQVEIVDFLARETERVDAIRAGTERSILLLKERRSALIAAAVTGQVDVEADS